MTGTRGIVLRGGRIVDPSDGFDGVGELWIEDGLIVSRGPAAGDGESAARIVDVRDLVVCPGFIDLHTHLRFPGFPAKEMIGSGTEAAAAGGFTTVCAMANTQPVVDTVETLRLVQEAAQRDAVVRVRQLAAVTYGLAGERLTDVAELAGAGAIAFSDDGKPVWNAGVMREALAASAALGTPISAHEEDPEIVRGGVANAGQIARRLGLPEWPCSGEASMAARDVALLESIGGRLHIAHVSCAETVTVLRAARERGLPVTAEVTPHHLRLSDRLLLGDAELGLPPAHPCVKVNPPLRSEADVAAMVEALADGTIDAIATDHAPHTELDKAGPYATAAFGFSGIETALPLVLDLVRMGAVSLPTAIERLTTGPARVFALDASLRPGAVADVCVFDPDEEWVVGPEGLRSRGKNTPLLGARLRGRVRWTVVGGEIVHSV